MEITKQDILDYIHDDLISDLSETMYEKFEEKDGDVVDRLFEKVIDKLAEKLGEDSKFIEKIKKQILSDALEYYDFSDSVKVVTTKITKELKKKIKITILDEKESDNG